MTRGRLGTASVILLLIAGSAAGCTSGDSPTLTEATSSGSKNLDALATVLAEHQEVTVPWHASDGTTAGTGCAEDEQRWTGLGTVTVKATTGDGDSPPTRLVAALDRAGWESGSNAGDLDDDPATVILAVPKGKNSAGLRLTVTIERVPAAWHYVVNLTSDCAAKS